MANRTLYWRNPKKNYAFEKIATLTTPEYKGLKTVFLNLDDDNPFPLPGGVYTIREENRLAGL